MKIESTDVDILLVDSVIEVFESDVLIWREQLSDLVLNVNANRDFVIVFTKTSYLIIRSTSSGARYGPSFQ